MKILGWVLAAVFAAAWFAGVTVFSGTPHQAQPVEAKARLPDPGNYPSDDQVAAQERANAERARIAYLDQAQAMQLQQEAAEQAAARDEAQRQRDEQLQQSIDAQASH